MRSLQIATSLSMSSPLDEIENPPALQHQVGLGESLPLLDGPLEKGDGVAHAVSFEGSALKSRGIVSGLPSPLK